MLTLVVVARTDVGKVRKGNEDAFLVGADGTDHGTGVRWFAVADGMGGHQAGEVASATAVAALRTAIGEGVPVARAVAVANAAVHDRAIDDPTLRGMGTTVTAAVLDGTALHLGHVGDSRAYLLRSDAFTQLTADHSLVAELVAAGEMTPEQAEIDPRRSMITRALGIGPEVHVDAFDVVVQDGDRLLFCSDGLTTMVRDDAIAEILRLHRDPADAATVLIAAANAAGGADNITVVVADVRDDPTADDADTDQVAAVDPTENEVGTVTEAVEVVDVIGVEVVGRPADGTGGATLVDPGADPGDPADPADSGDPGDPATSESAPRRRWWRRDR